MTTTLVAGAVLTGAGLITTLYGERFHSRPAVYSGKPAASLGFILVAVGSGALGSGYGTWVFAGLALSMAGDVFLMIEKKVFFLAGLLAFLLGHVAYGVAFLVLGVSTAWWLVAMAGSVMIAVVVLRWLMPHIEADMRGPVLGYVIVISVMVSLAVGTRGEGWTPLILSGAILFYVSDLFVARERFVIASYANKLLGLPLYYAGQLLLALSVAG